VKIENKQTRSRNLLHYKEKENQMKILLETIAVVALIVAAIILFIKTLPWLIGVVAVGGVILEIYRRWFRRNDGGAAPAPCAKEA
jgi:uncharacterized membrane protein YdbT with pleckstrin-like domain